MKQTCSNCEAANNVNAKYCSMCGYTLPVVENTIKDELSPVVETKKSKQKQPISTYIGIAVGVLLTFLVSNFFITPSIDSKLASFASEFNKNCPMVLDQHTTINNALALPNKTIQYNYTLTAVVKADVDLDILEENLFPRLLQSVKSSPEMKIFRDKDVSFKYYYSDSTGEFVTSYTINPKMYK